MNKQDGNICMCLNKYTYVYNCTYIVYIYTVLEYHFYSVCFLKLTFCYDQKHITLWMTVLNGILSQFTHKHIELWMTILNSIWSQTYQAVDDTT